MPSQVVRLDALRQLPFGSIGSSFTPIGIPFAHIMRMVKIVNNTNADMIISFDGTTNNDYVPAMGFTLYDFTANGDNTLFVFVSQTQMYAKYVSAPSSGNINVVCVYGLGE